VPTPVRKEKVIDPSVLRRPLERRVDVHEVPTRSRIATEVIVLLYADTAAVSADVWSLGPP
jgi:hypothetical protein